MITEYRFDRNMPYSLHDTRVSKIGFVGDSVVFEFENGYVSTKKPYPQVPGNITIEKVDRDFTYVVLGNEYGRYGDVCGMKLSLEEFIERYRDYLFEITDELHGYNQTEYGGYLYASENAAPVEMTVYVYHFGSIVYETEE